VSLRNNYVYAGVVLMTLAASTGWEFYSRPPAPVVPSANSLADAQAIGRWMTSYYRQPEPDRLGHALSTLSAAGFLKDPAKATMVAGFLAGLIETDAGVLDYVTPHVAKAPADQQRVVAMAATLAGRQDLLPALKAKLPSITVVIDRVLADQRAKSLREMTIDRQPELLDANWAYFMATGNEEPVLRIISTLEGISQEVDLHRMITGYSAKWSLASNAWQHPKVMAICRREAAARSEPVAGLLRDVVAAAEVNDARRIRSESDAAARAWKEREARNKG
jgi:hypothetical protein